MKKYFTLMLLMFFTIGCSASNENADSTAQSSVDSVLETSEIQSTDSTVIPTESVEPTQETELVDSDAGALNVYLVEGEIDS